ncbi:cysteine hydrolase family protein [Pseudomonas citronellolis]|uniref:cysteine hydrolase family protein n=1 Tax=Pseudomonas citronellolis TaxID=53408 RepID=UPI0023E37B82|nr:cysteine hydrolase family protein [Pseudomonas citronellolis]MDF3931639.1 cysteine hydrolase family protein [Pseudomonas citronellolis]
MSNAPQRALIVIDVQNEYFSGNLRIEYPPVGDSLPNILAAMDAAHAAGIPVVVVRHLAPAGAPIFAPGSHGVELHPQVAERPRDLLLDKSKASALSGTGLGDWLRERGVDTLSIVGYMTHNCDDSTARQAAHEGWQVEFLDDASGSLPYANSAGSASAEEIHRAFSVVLHSSFAAVASTAQWLAAVQSGKALERDNIYASNQRALAARG